MNRELHMPIIGAFSYGNEIGLLRQIIAWSYIHFLLNPYHIIQRDIAEIGNTFWGFAIPEAFFVPKIDFDIFKVQVFLWGSRLKKSGGYWAYTN